MASKKRVIVIGAGLGGLSVACRLARLGCRVTVVERNQTLGGKVNLVESSGYKFDTGASLVTMRHVFEELFEFCGRNLADYLELVRLEPVCRYRWSDGKVFDASDDLEKTEEGIAAIEPADIAGFRRYLADSKRKYEVAERTFLRHTINDLRAWFRFGKLSDLWTISAVRSLDAHNASYFKSPKLRQLFNRYATYNGSSPYRTPATFSLIPFVEFGHGAWYPMGGIYTIPRALARLAEELGVEFRTGADVERVSVTNGGADGVALGNGEFLKADIVVSNADAIATYRNLIDKRDRRIYDDRRLDRIEPSCSGFVLLLGVRKQFPKLAHHNIFFSDDYPSEFRSIFETLVPAERPTVYVCATSRTDPSQAPEGCENLFVLINAPYTSDRFDWTEAARPYRDRIVAILEESGLDGLGGSIDYEEILTPAHFESRYRANRGSIYGVSSNGLFSAFMRPANKARDIRNLYFVGGTTHPGGGMPLVLLSAKMAAEAVSGEQ